MNHLHVSDVKEGLGEFGALRDPIDYQLVLYLHHVVAILTTLFTRLFVVYDVSKTHIYSSQTKLNFIIIN